jgi:hypothetical protein
MLLFCVCPYSSDWSMTICKICRMLKDQGMRVIALETVKGKPMAYEYSFPFDKVG